MATNPYQFDPFLQAAFGNLSNALLGSAKTDADIALGEARKAQAENSLAAALANKSQARVRDAEAKNLEMINANALALSKSPYNQSRLLGQLYPNLAPVPGASTDFMAENVLQNALRATSANDIALAETNFTRNQEAIKRSNLIESLITSGDPLKMRQGFILANNDPGEFFDPGFAQEKDRRADATDRFKILEDNKTTSEKDRMANKTAIYEIDEKLKWEREKPIITTAAPGETVNIWSDGEVIGTHKGIQKTITMNVPDGSIGFAITPSGEVKEFNNERDPEAYIIPEDAIGFVPDGFGGWTKLKGKESTTTVAGYPGQTINILDSNGNVLKEIVVENNPTEVKANAGQTAVLLDSQTGEELFRLEGRDTTSTSSSSTPTWGSTQDKMADEIMKASPLSKESTRYKQHFNKVPDTVLANIVGRIKSNSSKAYQDNTNRGAYKNVRESTNAEIQKWLTGNVVLINPPLAFNEFGVPHRIMEVAKTLSRAKIIENAIGLGYSSKQANWIADEVGAN